MNNAQEVFSRISLDLDIVKYSCESEISYFTRLIYSAVGCWVLYCTGDKSVTEDTSIHGVSKSYINRRCSKILNDFLEICPQAKNWFFTGNITDCPDVIRYIREIYEYMGYLVSAGLDLSLTLPKYKKVAIEDGLVLYRGNAKVSRMIGLGTYEPVKEAKKEDTADLFDMFLIPRKRADIFLHDYLNKVNWAADSILECTQFYDYANADNWVDRWAQDKITIYKRGYADYGFAKLSNGQFHFCQFPDYIIREKEYRRFILGLKRIKGTNAKARLRKYPDMAVLTLNSRLPKKELVLLRLLSWPVKNIQDMYNYYVPTEVINMIKSILENLCIEVEEI